MYQNTLNKNDNKEIKLGFSANILRTEILLTLVLISISVFSIYYFFSKDLLISYGDTESHLNIAKRVVDSLTPGLAQLGGIWLPLPHLLLVPFVKIDLFWRTGLAGSIVSGVLFVVAGVYLYKLTKLVTASKIAGLVSVFVFVTNTNILYLQTTAMTEVPLIAFFILSIYYYIEFVKNDSKIFSLVLAGFFGLAASLSRYDGWFLVLTQAGFLILLYSFRIIRKYFRKNKKFELEKILKDKLIVKTEAFFLLFSTLALIGIAGWFLWDYLILDDPLYFTNSPFSAKSQQAGWQARSELPSHNNLWSSISYYTVTSYLNIGKITSVIALVGFSLFLFDFKRKDKYIIILLLTIPFIFYVVTLYMGQSVIFIPQLTPDTFEYQLFNVRYGVMMIPAAAFFVGYLFFWLKRFLDNPSAIGKYTVFVSIVLLFYLTTLQAVFFVSGSEQAITIEDGVKGLSSAKIPDAEGWVRNNYDGGLVLMDDYARTMSIIRSGIPMENMIYIGNKPYWEESLIEPEKHVRWIVTQENDTVWKRLIENKEQEARLYKYFQKAYTSPEILVFKRTDI